MTKKSIVKKPQRPIYQIAADIRAEINAGNWPKHAAFYAAPYLVAMKELATLEDKYLCDSARSIVLYFLANAQTWRGETARRIKAELRGILA